MKRVSEGNYSLKSLGCDLKSVGVMVEMNTPRGVLEIHSPQNKHILLDDDLADLLGLKRRLQTIK